jgi:nitrogen fixation protein FixH
MSEKPAKKKGGYWPLLIVLLSAIVLVPNAVLVYLATNDPSFAVEEDYYQKALAWDETMDQERRNEALGWSVDVGFAPGDPGRVRVHADLLDRDGRAIDGAAVQIAMFHNARASNILTAAMVPDDDGGYVASLPLRRPGLWELRFEIVHGDDRFTETLARELGRLP